MREATGGAFFLKGLIFVILLFFGIIFFAALYNKAFRMKSEMVSIFEKFEGNELLIRDELQKLRERSGYSPIVDTCPTSEVEGVEFIASQGNMGLDGLCVELICRSTGNNSYTGYYRIKTFVNIHQVPIFGSIFKDENLSVSGNTKEIYSAAIEKACRENAAGL